MKKNNQNTSSSHYRTCLIFVALVISLLSTLPSPSHAAYIMKHNRQAGRVQSASATRLFEADGKLNAFQQFMLKKVLRSYKPERITIDPPHRPAAADLATTSLVAGILSLCALGAAAITLSPGLFIVGAVFSIMAVIFGAIGLKSSKKRMALIGLIMGGVGLVALTVVLGIAISNFTIF